jgi:hypothetical protein
LYAGAAPVPAKNSIYLSCLNLPRPLHMATVTSFWIAGL